MRDNIYIFLQVIKRHNIISNALDISLHNSKNQRAKPKILHENDEGISKTRTQHLYIIQNCFKVPTTKTEKRNREYSASQTSKNTWLQLAIDTKPD